MNIYLSCIVSTILTKEHFLFIICIIFKSCINGEMIDQVKNDYENIDVTKGMVKDISTFFDTNKVETDTTPTAEELIKKDSGLLQIILDTSDETSKIIALSSIIELYKNNKDINYEDTYYLLGIL